MKSPDLGLHCKVPLGLFPILASMSEQQKQKKLGRYNLLDKLGAGGMGSVYKAQDTQLERVVALKILSSKLAKDQNVVDRFMREGRMAGALSHPNIVRALEVGQEGKYYYLAMEYVDGVTLKQALKSGPFSEREAIDIATDVAIALQHAASKNIMHRDIKPENIMLTGDDEVKILDMGLARTTDDDATLTQAGRMIGTPSYSSPEQIRGETTIDGRTDIYSLGHTLFHLLTGRRAFDGSTAGVIINMHLTDPMPDPRADAPELSAEICAVLKMMTQRNPEDRYQTPDDLLEDLAHLRNDQPLVHAAKKRVVRTPRASRSKSGSGIFAAVGAAAAAAILGCMLMLGSGKKKEPEKHALNPTTTPATTVPPTVSPPAPPPTTTVLPDLPVPLPLQPVENAPAPSVPPGGVTADTPEEAEPAPEESPGGQNEETEIAPIEPPTAPEGTAEKGKQHDIFTDVAAYNEIKSTLMKALKERDYLAASTHASVIADKPEAKRFTEFLKQVGKDILLVSDFVDRAKAAFREMQGQEFTWAGLPARIVSASEDIIVVEVAGREKTYPFSKVRVLDLARAAGVPVEEPGPLHSYLIGVMYLSDGQHSRSEKYFRLAKGSHTAEAYRSFVEFEREALAGELIEQMKESREKNDFRAVGRLLKEGAEKYANTDVMAASDDLIADIERFVTSRLAADGARVDRVIARVEEIADSLEMGYRGSAVAKRTKIRMAQSKAAFDNFFYTSSAQTNSSDGDSYHPVVTVNGEDLYLYRLSKTKRRYPKGAQLANLKDILAGHKKKYFLEGKSRRTTEKEIKRLQSDLRRSRTTFENLQSRLNSELSSRLKTLKSRRERLSKKVAGGANPSNEQILNYLKTGR